MQTTSADDSSWEQIAPLLDEAMSRLGEKDRNVLALRFFEQKSLEEVGAALGIDTGTAQKRVWRAVDKLRQYFARHGAAFSAATLATALSTHALHAMPSGLAATVAATAALKGTAATASTATLINGTLKLMALTKAKTALVAGAVLLLAAGTTAVTVRRIYEKQQEQQQTYSWQVPGFNGNTLAKAKPMLAILPSKEPYGAWGNMGNKLMGTGVSAQKVVEAAYSDQDKGSLQTVVMTGLPPGKFDFIASLPDRNAAALREEVKRKFGVAARTETRETNVLILTVKNANAPGLKPDTSSADSSNSTGGGEYSCVNQSLSSLVFFLSSSLNIPVIDQTEDRRTFDINLKWDVTDQQHPNSEAMKQALLDQLGLELVPAIKPIPMLVIEKAK